jgi:lysophospholipase L1-like esterase
MRAAGVRGLLIYCSDCDVRIGRDVSLLANHLCRWRTSYVHRNIWMLAAVSTALATATIGLSHLPKQKTVIFGDSLVNSLSSNLLKTVVVNHSVDGATTVHIAEAVSNYRIETNFRNVRQVIVQGGINDLLQGNRGSIGRSYQSILETVPDITPVLIIGILPFDPNRIRIDPSEVDSANHQISEICLTHANCEFVQPMGRTISPEMLSDGLHLKADGIRALASRLREQLR